MITRKVQVQNKQTEKYVFYCNGSQIHIGLGLNPEKTRKKHQNDCLECRPTYRLQTQAQYSTEYSLRTGSTAVQCQWTLTLSKYSSSPPLWSIRLEGLTESEWHEWCWKSLVRLVSLTWLSHWHCATGTGNKLTEKSEKTIILISESDIHQMHHVSYNALQIYLKLWHRQ